MDLIHIGTSGWVYDHWDKTFYHGLSAQKWLSFYSEQFETVEINSTFYRLPTAKAVSNWQNITPEDFVFSVKMSRYITHIKRLKDTSQGILRFLQTLEPLQNKLGPILFLIPPFLKVDYERLQACIENLPQGYDYTFEFRNPAWFTPRVFELFEKHNISLCISDYEGRLSPIEVTANFVYVRLHGPNKAYRGSYSPKELKTWGKQIKKWANSKLEVYLYFDNDEKGFAPKNALELKQLLSLD